MLRKRANFGLRVFYVSSAVVVAAAFLTILFIFAIELSSRGYSNAISILHMDNSVHELASEIDRHIDDPHRWPSLMKDLRQKRSLSPLCFTILDSDGHVRYADSNLLEILYPGSGTRLTRAQTFDLLAGKSRRHEGDVAYVVAPLQNNGRPAGVLVGDIHPYSPYEPKGAPGSALYLLLPVIATLLASLAGSLYLGHSLRKRLAGLTAGMRAIAEGDYKSRLPLGSSDEIGQAAAEFNLMADRVQKAREQEEALERLKRDLITNVSHDLRGPLTSVRGYLEALEDGLATNPEAAMSYVGIIRRKSEQLAHLVDDLFVYSRLESGHLPLDLQRVSLAEWLRESLAVVETDTAAAGIELEAEIADVPVPACIDVKKMDQVVANVVQNAVRYAPKGSLLRITMTAENGEALISVVDQGPGFDLQDLRHVFERFYRGRNQADGVGTGLGLAIAALIVKAHSGRIWAENPPEGGAAVRFAIPAVTDAPGGG